MEKSGGVDVNLLSTKVCAAAPFLLEKTVPTQACPCTCSLSAESTGVKVLDTGRKQHAGTEYMCQN